MNTVIDKQDDTTGRFRPDKLQSWAGAVFCVFLCLPGSLYLILWFIRDVWFSLSNGDLSRSPWLVQKLAHWEVDMRIAAMFGGLLAPVPLVLALFLTIRGELPIRAKATLWVFLSITAWAFSVAASEWTR